MRVGIIGGGQLSRMLALSSMHLGIEFSFFINTKEHSVNGLGKLFHGDFQQLKTLDPFIDESDVITYENENVPNEVLNYISAKRPLHPNKDALTYTQDRLLEKQLFNKLHIPTNDFLQVETLEDIKLFLAKHDYPIVLKKRRFGYDGRNQVVIKNEKILIELQPEQISNCIAEEFIPFDREISIIATRSKTEIFFYDINQNFHENGILKITENKSNDPMAKIAESYIQTLLEKFNYIGTLAIEFFSKDNQLLANEVAPRVHNTGHWTIEGTVTSQFENHIRAILDLPLGSTKSILHCKMLNIISTMPELKTLLTCHPLAIHDYMKKPRELRKLGHITIDVNEKNTNLEKLISLLK